MSATDRPGVFVSHAVADKPIADALRLAIDRLFQSGRVEVNYSTSKEEGGIPTGTPWFQWIVDQVLGCDVAFVLLTPSSIQRPWIPWEAGAVYGAALSKAQAATEQAPVLPLLFHISADELPDPFGTIQFSRGDQAADVHRTFTELIIRFKRVLGDEEYGEAFGRREVAVGEFLARVEAALATAPLTPTEAAVQEWCRRLDDLRAQRRFSEARHVHDWLEIAFGRESDDAPRPLDLRIHRRLGELYLDAEDQARAAVQFELCRKLAPRDLFVLRSLGQAYLTYDRDAARRIIDAIDRLDARAFAANAECAALKGRWLREHDPPLLEEARDVFEQALKSNPRSYYLAGRLAQTLRDLGDDRATAAYERVQSIVEGLEEQNLWTHADAATAAVAAGKPQDAVAHLAKAAGFRPSKGEVESIERGLRELLASMGREPAEITPLHEALATRPGG